MPFFHHKRLISVTNILHSSLNICYFKRTLCSSNKHEHRRVCKVYRHGLVPYRTAWEWQHQEINARCRRNNDSTPLPDTLMLLQHPRVYTLGRRASMDNVKFDPLAKNAPELIKVDRGGEVTYHGPGQLVVYPILDLRNHRKDLHWYLRQVEAVVINALKSFDIDTTRHRDGTGVWTNTNPSFKIAAVGTHASKWITMHGFALNVTTDLRDFENIIPCGISENPRVTSVTALKPHVTMEEVENAVIRAFGNVFKMEMSED